MWLVSSIFRGLGDTELWTGLIFSRELRALLWLCFTESVMVIRLLSSGGKVIGLLSRLGVLLHCCLLKVVRFCVYGMLVQLSGVLGVVRGSCTYEVVGSCVTGILVWLGGILGMARSSYAGVFEVARSCTLGILVWLDSVLGYFCVSKMLKCFNSVLGVLGTVINS